MNYLAHAILSGTNKDVLMGNMLGDFVKGNKYLNYKEDIQKGILLHRFIDSFTDTHKIVKEAKQYFRNDFGLYSGVFIDTIFDHFVANYYKQFNSLSLADYAQEFYKTVYEYETLMPEKMKYTFGYMRQYNWLHNYQSQDGMYKTLINMCKRFDKTELSNIAVQLFINHYKPLQALFQDFYPELEKECKKRLKSVA